MLSREPVPPFDDVSERRAVLALEPFEQGQAILHLGEARRRTVDARREVAQRGREILELGLDALALPEIGGEPGVEAGQLLDPLPHAPQVGQRRAVSVIQVGIAVAAQPLDGVGAAQDLPRGRELDVLVGLKGRLAQLAQLELDELEAGRPLAAVHAQPIELVTQPLDSREGGRDLLPERRQTGPGVEHGEVLAGVEQLLMLVLPVQLHEPGGEFLERRRGGQRAGDERPAPALDGDLAAHDDLARRTALVREVEYRFDDRHVLTGAHEVRRGAPAEEQPHRLDEDRFAGPGLAGEDVERGFKLDGGRFDDREILDRQVADHGGPALRGRAGGSDGKSIVSEV